MKILYGICGEGFGHSSRARSVIEHLKKSGHKVLILTYAQGYSALKEFNPVDIFGVEPTYHKGRISLWKSFFDNQKKLLKKSKDFPKIKKIIDKFDPDLCISDMEPFVPIISFWKKLPLISIDNQHSLIFSDMKVPLKYKKDYFVAKSVINRCVSHANHFIVLSFVKSQSITKNKKAFFVSPLLRQEIQKLKPKSKDFVLVYLSKPNDKLIKVLEQVNEKFIVYGQKEKGKSKTGTIVFKKKGKTFLKDLENCKAVVASSGFSLISESLYLGKPYFAIPLKGQFEQVQNSLFLKKHKLGEYSENPTSKEIGKFISNLKEYQKNIRKQKSNPNEALQVLDKLLKNF